MKIESSNKSLATNGPRASAAEPRVKPAPPFTAASEELTQALNKVPIVRAEKVASLKALMANGPYPSEETLGKVADLLAQHLDQGVSQ